jgi:hypothetical protein
MLAAGQLYYRCADRLLQMNLIRLGNAQAFYEGNCQPCGRLESLLLH